MVSVLGDLEVIAKDEVVGYKKWDDRGYGPPAEM